MHWREGWKENETRGVGEEGTQGRRQRMVRVLSWDTSAGAARSMESLNPGVVWVGRDL